jgi:hypothetical protein
MFPLEYVRQFIELEQQIISRLYLRTGLELDGLDTTGASLT